MTKKISGSDTGREIYGQPALWTAVHRLVQERNSELVRFLQPIFQLPGLQIILTGAGSSAFIGESAQGPVQQLTGIPCRAVPTTDLITHPHHYFYPICPTLLVSFARSGNSPESLQTVLLAKKHCREFYHLVITCNKNGQLLKTCAADTDNTYCFVLPEEANDKSLAMTGSFTSMLLSMLLVADCPRVRSGREVLTQIIGHASQILDRRRDIQRVGEQNYERVVFLGSGPMLGIARECQLKLQELTDGRVICKHDSFLGFRHGPRVVVNAKTLVVYLFSENDHVFQYERDLVQELMGFPEVMGTIHVGKRIEGDPHEQISLIFDGKIPGYNAIPATLIGQLLGYYKSMALGLDPDNPSVSGAISRVVQGVTLYEKNQQYTDSQ